MLQPVKTALGQFMGRYFASIVPTTKPLEGFVARPLDKAIAWAPARMIDAAEEMLSLWLRSDLENAPTTPPELPAIIVAMAKDYTPTGRDYTRQVADRQMVMIPEDAKERLFGLRAVAGDVRAQLVVFATDEPSAHSLAAQFLLFLDETENRRFEAIYRFAGLDTAWPVQIESPDAPAMSIQTDAKNLTVLAIDMTLRAEIPLFDAPKEGEPHDGQGTPGTDDPAGYPLVQTVSVESAEAGDQGGVAEIRSYEVSADDGREP
ncbi:MAG: hypothetical protein LBS49_12830 [Candidatus Accumulibacter sp.]|jgi:hypothetical protein|nr:hypothetical protein [Accumulibacter sp.]